jgi:hypothetical protein
MTTKGDNMNERKAIQHGEIMLLPVGVMPSGETTPYDGFIVGHSETGHHHVLESAVKFDVLDDQEKHELYLRLYEPAELVHQKSFDQHRTLTVKPGVWKVLHKTEYDPFEQIIKTVKD